MMPGAVTPERLSLVGRGVIRIPEWQKGQVYTWPFCRHTLQEAGLGGDPLLSKREPFVDAIRAGHASIGPSGT
jgi:hypothetical protein